MTLKNTLPNTTATEEITRSKFNTLKKYYDQTWDHENHTLHVGVFENPENTLIEAYRNATRLLIEKVYTQKPISKESNVLDVGCGAGRTLIEICEQFECSGTGVDLSDEQIKDAQIQLNKVNNQRNKMGLKPLSINFIRGSASELDTQLTENEIFSHVISQDAIMMVANKLSLFENISRLLQPGGAMVVADFVSEANEDSLQESEQKAIYKFINWTNALSEENYKILIKNVGLNLVETENRNPDMIQTYSKLAEEIDAHVNENDQTYAQLKERYENIVQAVQEGKMGWDFFTAEKAKKVALLAGTKPTSIGRAAAETLRAKGWEIWLYSRSAEKVDQVNWHERSCDLTSEEAVRNLLAEIGNIDLSVFLADTGNAKGEMADIDLNGIAGSFNAKILGSISLCKQLVEKVQPNKKMQLVWCAGKPKNKSKDTMGYGIINSGIEALVEGINHHYGEKFDCFYLETPLISPSPLGDEYIDTFGKHLQAVAKSPSVICEKIIEITEAKQKPGYVEIVNDAI